MTRSITALALGFLCAACADATTAEVTKSAPPVMVASPLVAPSMDAVQLQQTPSSVCTRYLRERAKVQIRLSNAPGDSALALKSRSLTAKIGEACS